MIFIARNLACFPLQMLFFVYEQHIFTYNDPFVVIMRELLHISIFSSMLTGVLFDLFVCCYKPMVTSSRHLYSRKDNVHT